MKQTLLLITLLLVIGCKSEKKETLSENNETELQQIEFLAKEIHFPENYRKTSLEEVTEVFKQIPNPNGYEVAYMNGLQNLKNFNVKFEVFTEKENFMNSIWFMLGEYIPLDKSIVNTYVNMLEQQLLPQTEKFGIEYKRLESKLLTNKNTKAIKVKYQQILNGNKRYLTQYLVTYKLKTFSFVVSNKENIDYQFMTKNFGTY
jgi:hypothetical protein